MADYARALEALEAGLEIAESLGSRVMNAEWMVSKSWALAGLLQPVEGSALAMGGLEIAEQEGAIPTALRARFNASNWYCADDPRRAPDIASAGFDLAMRVGHGDWAATLASNAGAAETATRDWDRIVGFRDALADARLPAQSRLGVAGMAWAVDAYRGARRWTSLATRIHRRACKVPPTRRGAGSRPSRPTSGSRAATWRVSRSRRCARSASTGVRGDRGGRARGEGRDAPA